MSPEYALEGLLLEIVSGRKNTGFYQTDSLHLIGYVSNLFAFFVVKL
jgi:hypothetical protein